MPLLPLLSDINTLPLLLTLLGNLLDPLFNKGTPFLSSLSTLLGTSRRGGLVDLGILDHLLCVVLDGGLGLLLGERVIKVGGVGRGWLLRRTWWFLGG